MNGKATVILKIHNRKFDADVEVPLDLTAQELVVALNTAYQLGIDTGNIRNCFLRAEHPIALLKGSKTLEDFGIRDGSVIHITD